MTASTGLEAATAEPEATEAAAALLAAVADPVRLALLHRLAAEGSCCVCDLQPEPPVAANLLSYHLRVLREAGLIAGTRRGRWIDYALVEGALGRLHATLPATGPLQETGAPR